MQLSLYSFTIILTNYVVTSATNLMSLPEDGKQNSRHGNAMNAHF